MSSEQGKRKLTRRQLIGSSLGVAGALAAG